MTALIISHESALAYWSHPEVRTLPSLNQADASDCLESARKSIHVKALKSILSLPEYASFPKPLDLLVPSKGEARTTKTARFHYCRELKAKSICPIEYKSHYTSKDLFSVFACTPELTFVQMATILDDVELLEVGYELCGDYSLHPQNDGAPSKRPPVSTPEKIARFISQSSDIPGIARARRVVGWLLAGSRSPKESQLAIIAVLPAARGGYKLPQPLLNERIAVPPNVATVLGASSIIPDLYWPDDGIVLEYDSDFAHGAHNADHDARKRSAYRMMGLDLVSLTYGQLYDRAAFTNIMTDLARRLTRSHKRTPPTNAQLEERERLYDQLFIAHRRERGYIMPEAHVRTEP